MICPTCKIEMEIGIAINPRYPENVRSFAPLTQVLKAHEVKMIEVFKCPKCGHSDDGN